MYIRVGVGHMLLNYFLLDWAGGGKERERENDEKLRTYVHTIFAAFLHRRTERSTVQYGLSSIQY